MERRFTTNDKPSAHDKMRFAFILTMLLLPCLATAASSERMIKLSDGSSMKVFMFDADDGSAGPWPLTVLMSAGRANEYVARAQFWLGYELAQRGWTIAVPVSPDSRSFVGRNGELIPELIEKLQAHNNIRSGKVLLVGVSNGGTAALEIAARHPQRYYGVVAVPGNIRNELPLPELDGLPVYLRIGENDRLRWDQRLQEITRRLQDAGAQVDARLVDGARHVFPLDWDELQPWLERLTAMSEGDQSAILP